MWTNLAILAVVSLVCFWKGPNAVGAGAMIGLIGGIIADAVSFLIGNGFHAAIVGKWFVVATLVGTIIEVVGRLSIKK